MSKLSKYAMGGTFNGYKPSDDTKKKKKQLKKAEKSYEKWNNKIMYNSAGISGDSKKGKKWTDKRKQASDKLKSLKGGK